MADKKPTGAEVVTNIETEAEPKPKIITFKMAGIDGDPDEVVTWEILPPVEIAYYYLPEKNPLGASLPGVPLSDLSVGQVKRYPKHIQKSIKGSPMYKAANDPEEGEGKGGDK